MTNYLNNIRGSVRTVIFFVFCLFTGFFIICLDTLLTEGLLREAGAVVAFLTPVWICVPFMLRMRTNLHLAKVYAKYFAESPKAFVPLEDLALLRNRSSEKVRKELEKLFKNKYFAECSLRSEPYGVFLANKMRRVPVVVQPRVVAPVVKPVLIGATCPHCGGTTRIYAGSIGTCDYCGSSIVGKLSV